MTHVCPNCLRSPDEYGFCDGCGRNLWASVRADRVADGERAQAAAMSDWWARSDKQESR